MSRVLWQVQMQLMKAIFVLFGCISWVCFYTNSAKCDMVAYHTLLNPITH